MGKLIDLTGREFERLKVVERAGADDSGRAIWKCECKCGKVHYTTGTCLRNGQAKSCGCLHNEMIADQGRKNKTHGEKSTKLYRHWSAMKSRCYNENNIRYHRYGGRGITVCPEWTESFETFRDWALANGYRDGLTLDRNDTNGPYSPENCRWATQKEQQNNRMNNRLLEHDGETKTLQQWAEETGIDRRTIQSRLSRGWSLSRALTKE